MVQRSEGIRTLFSLAAAVVIAVVAAMLVSQMPTGLVFVVISGLILAIVCFVNPEIGLYLLICAMLLGPEFVVGQTGGATLGRGITIRVDDLLLVVIGFSWFLSTAVNKERGLFLKTPLNRYIAYYFFACLVSTLIGYMMQRVKGIAGFLFVLKYFEYFIVYFMTVNYLKERKQMERLVMMMLVVCAIVCVIAIMQIPSGVRVSAPFEGEGGEPNTLGGYLVLMLSIVLGLLTNNYGSGKVKTFFGILIFLILITLAATLSRSSWLALVPMLATLIWFSKRKMVIIIPLIFLVLLAGFLAPPGVKQRVMFTFKQPSEQGQLQIGRLRIDTSTSARLQSWKEVIVRDFYEHPLLGYGITGYHFLDAQYPRVLAETGLVGFFSFSALLVAIYRNVKNTWRRYTGDQFYLGITTGFLAGFFAMLVHAIGANTFIIVRIMEPFWFMTAIIIMIPQIEPISLPDTFDERRSLKKPL